MSKMKSSMLMLEKKLDMLGYMTRVLDLVLVILC